MNSSTFCPRPFTHIELYHDGRVRPCCKAQMGSEHINEIGQNLDFWNNSSFRKIRKQLLNNEKPSECEHCWKMEDSNALSLRQEALKGRSPHLAWFNKSSEFETESYTSSSSPQHLMVTLSNFCNLQCRMCNGLFSSRWEKAFKKSQRMKDWFNQNNLSDHDYVLKPNRPDISSSIIEFVKKSAHNLEVLDLLGGEPFLQPQHIEILQACGQFSKNIHLSYSSNMTSFGPNFKQTQNFWKTFKGLSITTSIDGSPETNERVRHGASTETISHNVEVLREWAEQVQLPLNLYGSIALSAYNIAKFKESAQFITSLGLSFIGNTVDGPSFLSPTVLPLANKQQITFEFDKFCQNIENELAPSFTKHPRWKSKKSQIHQIENIKLFLRSSINFMNSQDKSKDFPLFVEFNEIFDSEFL